MNVTLFVIFEWIGNGIFHRFMASKLVNFIAMINIVSNHVVPVYQLPFSSQIRNYFLWNCRRQICSSSWQIQSVFQSTILVLFEKCEIFQFPKIRKQILIPFCMYQFLCISDLRSAYHSQWRTWRVKWDKIFKNRRQFHSWKTKGEQEDREGKVKLWKRVAVCFVSLISLFII